MTIILLLPAYFYPRSPCGERLRGISSGRAETAISIHALLAESDKLVKTDTSEHLISIHALLAESDKIPYQRQIDQKNFYPRSPCGERRAFFMPLILSYEISIHALLAESDNAHLYYHSRGLNISIHALLAESDTGTLNPKKYDRTFLSTLSLRRATFSYFLHIHRPLFLSTLSLRRATPSMTRQPTPSRFLSTLSLRRATA